MPVSSLALRQTAQPINTTLFELKSPGGVAPAILEIGLSTQSAVSIGLGRPPINCTGPTSIRFQNDNPYEPDTNVTGAITYSATGGQPDAFYRRWSPVSNTTGIVWTFPRGLRVPPGSTMVLWNIVANVSSNVDFHFIIEE